MAAKYYSNNQIPANCRVGEGGSRAWPNLMETLILTPSMANFCNYRVFENLQFGLALVYEDFLTHIRY